MKDVLGLTCSNFLRDFLLEESAWLWPFLICEFMRVIEYVLGFIPCEKCMSSVTTKPRSVRGAQCVSVVWVQQLFPSRVLPLQ